LSRSLLSDDEIEEGKQLRTAGWTKRMLALHFNVSPTVIWVRIYSPSGKYDKKTFKNKCVTCEEKLSTHLRCECGILLHDDILDGEIGDTHRCNCGLDHTAKVKNLCIACYSKKNNLHMPQSDYTHSHEELGQIFGKSPGTIVQYERRVQRKIVKSPQFQAALSGTHYYPKYKMKKIRRIEALLKEIPQDQYYNDIVGILNQWKEEIRS
jgi:hypothetical protein